MSTFNPRAALVAAMLSLPGAGASALTCAEDPARAETLAREATAIIIGRVALLPDPDAAPQAEAAAPPGAPPAPTVFATAPIVHELTVEATEVLKGAPPAGVFRARFLERACQPPPPEGKRRILYLVHDDDGWRVLGRN